MKFDGLHTMLATDAQAGRIAGAVSLIARAGRIERVDSAGWLDPQRAHPVVDDAIFWIASMTKPVTSVAALMLVDEGRLRLSDRVGDHLPQLRGLPVLGGAAAREPTVLDLMRHTAGFTYGFAGDSPVHAAYQSAGLHDYGQSGAEMLDKLSRIPLLYAPGTTFEYGMSTDVLACVVESRAGLPFDAFLQERLFEPLRMRATGFRVAPADRHRIARPLAHEDLSLAPPATGVRWASGGAGLWSTAGDYFRFAQMLLNGGELDGVRVLRGETVAAMRTDQLPPGVRFGSYTAAMDKLAPTPEMGRGFGLGLSVRTAPGEGPMPGSPGDFTWPGVSGTSFWCDPARQLTVVVMMQAPSLRVAYRELARDCVYRDLG